MANLFECLDLFESRSQVDREAGVIRRVKILGWVSANGREYDPKGVDPKLYEGRVVNIDHIPPGKTASARDRFGRVTGVTKESAGLYGDLEYLKSHPMAESVAEAAERMPGVFGMSHTAKGRTRQGPKGLVVEAVESVQSVDLVGDPATVTGLYEGKNMAKLTVAEVARAIKVTRPGYSRALLEMAEAGIMSPGAEMDMPADPPVADPVADEAIDHEQALLDAAKAVLDDGSMDAKAKMAKIKQILGIIGSDEGPVIPAPEEGSAEEDEEPKEEDAEKKESRKAAKDAANLREELGRLKSRDMLRNLADEAGVRLPAGLLDTVRRDITEAEARKVITLIGEMKGGSTSGRQAVRSATPKTATTGTVKAGAGEIREAKVPEDPKQIGRWLNGR